MRRFLPIVMLFFTLSVSSAEDLSYTLSVDDDMYDHLSVELEIDDVHADRYVISMPGWIPGTYYIGDFGKYIYNFTARDADDNPLPVLQLNRNAWEVGSSGRWSIYVTYDIETRQRGFMGNPLDSTGALVQGATTWVYVNGLEHLPCRVEVKAPSDWQMATGLTATEFPHHFRALNYDQLADSPIMMGDLETFGFKKENVPHDVVFRGRADFDRDKFVAMVRDIVGYQIGLFGDLPYEKYVFLYTLSEGRHGGGGLEHANSTTITLSALDVMDNIYSAANVTAHEFFHVWNVKRISAKALIPLDYSREARTELLWWLEGVTSYYADLTLVRTGIWTPESFLNNQERRIEQLQENPDRLQTPVSQASWDIWEDGFMSTGISVYTKGQLLGLLIDLMIRKNTDNRMSLDDVFRYLNIHYGRRGIGITERALKEALRSVSGLDFQPFFDRYVTGVVELPYQSVLAHAGLDIDIKMASKPTIGHVRILGPRNRVFSISPESSAAEAGLMRNDFIKAVDSLEIDNRKQFTDYIRKLTIGDTIRIKIERDGVDLVLRVPVESYEKSSCTLRENPSAPAEATILRRQWIEGK